MKATIIIQGVVQGVGYRFFAVDQAKQYNIRGYAKNLPNGDVEVVAEGDEGMIKDYIEQLKVGPVSAHVTGVNVEWIESEFGFKNFDIRY